MQGDAGRCREIQGDIGRPAGELLQHGALLVEDLPNKGRVVHAVESPLPLHLVRGRGRGRGSGRSEGEG